MPFVSPEGMWLAYVSNESGRPEVYVRPMPGPGGRVQISTDGGLEPMWSPKPGELFYRGSGKVILARVNIHEAAPSVTRQVLFDDIYVPSPVHAMYDVSPDGSRLLFTKSAGGDSKTIVVLNWLTEVRERFARARMPAGVTRRSRAQAPRYRFALADTVPISWFVVWSTTL